MTSVRPVRIGFAAVLATLVLLLLADAGAWWLLTGRLLSRAAVWQRELAAAGCSVTGGPPRRAGWPLRAEVVVPDLTLAAGLPGQAGALSWQAGEARLSAPWRPGAVTLTPGGAQALRAGNLVMPLAAGQLAVTVAPGGGVTVSGRGLRLTLPAGEATADTARLRWQGAEASLALAAPAMPGGALPGGGASRLELHARWTRPVPPQRDPAALAAWRDAGGRLILDGASFRWGPLAGQGEATLGLDGALQVEAAGLLRLTGFAEAIGALAGAGAITRGSGQAAGALLGLLATRGPDGVLSAALPFTVRDGVLSVGAIPLLRLPP